jgi:hypothetical protein
MTVLEALMAAGLFVAPQGPIVWPDPPRERTFADELATIPGAFDAAMKQDRPDIADMIKPSTEGRGGGQ